ncbi:hypothetical protein ACO1O0_005485 [Amphichorda felina]
MNFEQPLTRETANPNAATAAASAFMRREPSISLSSAAAAAALKARPTTPTNVAAVQSKRSLRRSASVSSTGGRGRGQGYRELRRTPSTGSLSERTLRSPSPGRSPPPRRTNVPPVPSLPASPQTRPQRPSSSHNAGAIGPQTQQFRTASQKLKDGKQGAWFGGAAARDDASARTSDAVLQSSYSSGDVRSGSVSPSINFSYPRGSMESPGPPTAHEQVMVYDANSRRMVPKSDLLARSQNVRDTSEKPVKKKISAVPKDRSHLPKGTAGRTQAAAAVEKSLPPSKQSAEEPPRPALAPASEYRQEGPRPASQPKPERAPETPDRSFVEPEPSLEESNKRDMRVVDGATVMPPSNSNHAPTFSKGVHSVLEESEREDDTDAEEHEPVRQHGAIDALPVRASQAAADDIDEKPLCLEQHDTEPKALAEENSAFLTPEAAAQSGGARRARVHSESPVRSAHFAPKTDQLLVRHEPPPRSLSPRKSALKHSSGVRGASPSDDGSEASGRGASFIAQDEPSRRRSVRVSFNDESNVIVGESAESPETEPPIVPSPQASKKAWHSILGRNRKDTPSLEDAETMTPRPALPLFGSVREKKPREPDSERPLVRPSERPWSPTSVSSALTRDDSNDTGLGGPSTDSAIGSFLSQESSSRNEANISRMREPLPPVVTSIEGTGYDSSSIFSTDDDMDHSDIHELSETPEPSSAVVAEEAQNHREESEELEKQGPVHEQKAVNVARSDEGETRQHDLPNADHIAHKPEGGDLDNAKQDETIPSISISNPTPLPQEKNQPSPASEYFDIPGGFPRGSPSEEPAISSRPEPAIQSIPQTATSDGTDPPLVASPSEAAISSAATSPSMADIPEEGTDQSSIYSDAYEDMSDAEGGFMSLDAVLTTPGDSKISKLHEKAKRHLQEKAASLASTVSGKDEELQEPPQTQDEWENAKTYWRSLSIEKRRQLEKEALEEAGEDADEESVKKPKKQAKKRASTDRPISSISTSGNAQLDRVYQIPPGSSWTNGPHEDIVQPARMSSPHPTPAVAPPLRDFVRGEQPKQAKVVDSQQPGDSKRKTLRGKGVSGGARGPVPSGTAAARPVSCHPPATIERQGSARRTLSSEPRPVSSGGLPSLSLRPTLRRQSSADSESSFKRNRAGGQGFGFRSSMRPLSQGPHSPGSKGSGRFSLRSLSPPASTFRGSSVAPQHSMGRGMPTTMRHSMRTGLGQREQPSKRGMSVFGRSPGKKVKKGKISRFEDSSDEDDGGRMFFSSRFDDSSDEDNSPMRAHQRGVSRGRPGERSPEILFSDDDVGQPKRSSMGNGTNGHVGGTLRRSRSGRGSLASPAAPGHLETEGVGDRPPRHQRRGSFMSTILRRKKDNSGRVSREMSESAARRDTKLERSSEELSVLRRNSSGKPRLHKREPSWPLPDGNDDNTHDGQNLSTPVGIANDPIQRPATSAGPGAAPPSKTSFLKRRSTSHQPVAAGYPPPEATDAHKKKKFGTLRRMFGLND